VSTVLRADQRFVTAHDGITSWHCFSAGPHYDPERIAFGPLVGVDEHFVAPGTGFDWHAHRGVTIVSWVLDGALRHEDSNGGEHLVEPGGLFVQSMQDGGRHREWNASESVALRFVQTTLVGEAPPVRVATAGCSVRGFAFVARGVWVVDRETLTPGDSLRADQPADLHGSGELVVVEFGAEQSAVASGA
jgi:hypothetical protein